MNNIKVDLDKNQQAAVDAVVEMVTEPAASERRLHFIAGGPGRGKSTIIASIIETLKDADIRDIRACAPTGKAAMVVNMMLSDGAGKTEKPGVIPISPASTIHRLLGCQGSGQWIYNEINRLEADLILLDEASMVDSEMFYRLLCSVSTDCRIVAIGDHGQLAPVGPGSPFSDFVESSATDTPYVNKLLTNYRQIAGSMLADAVEDISIGKMVKFCASPGNTAVNAEKDAKDTDFFFHECENRDNVAEALGDVIETWHRTGKDYMCIVPQKKGPVGCDVLNPVLQERLNPNSEHGVKVYKNVIKAGDIVRQTKNDYNLGISGIFNGYIGKVIYADKKSCIVEYPGWPKPEQVEYTQRKQLNNLTLGYAVTCHAAQGSQADYIAYLAHRSNYGMLTNQNIYVGVSRAKKECRIVGQLDMVQRAVKNRRSVKRNTHLKELLSNEEN